MLPKSHKIGSLVLRNILRFASLLAVAVLLFSSNENAFAGQFQKFAHAEYVFVGFVNEARVEPILKDSKTGLSEPKNNANKDIHYVVASVSPAELIVGSPAIGKEGRALPVCSDQNVIVGKYYLFIADNKLIKDSKCLSAVVFLLGAPPGKKPNSSILLTSDMLLMLPPSPVLDQYKLVMPDAHMRLDECRKNTVVVETYLDLHDFIDLMKGEKTRVQLPK